MTYVYMNHVYIHSVMLLTVEQSETDEIFGSPIMPHNRSAEKGAVILYPKLGTCITGERGTVMVTTHMSIMR